MNRETGHIHAGSRRRVGADHARRSTRRALLLAAAAWPGLVWTGSVFAQSKQPIVIGWLNTGSRESIGHLFAAFKEGLAALGWKEGSNYVMEERWADGRTDRCFTLFFSRFKPASLFVSLDLTAILVNRPTGIATWDEY